MVGGKEIFIENRGGVLNPAMYQQMLEPGYFRTRRYPDGTEVDFVELPGGTYQHQDTMFSIVGGKSPRLVICLGGLGRSATNTVSQRSYHNRGSLAGLQIMTRYQFLAIDPPLSGPENPLTFGHSVNAVKEVVNHVVNNPTYTQPLDVTFLCDSQGGLLATELLKHLGRHINTIPISEIAWISPAGILPEGIEHIKNRMERFKRGNVWRIKERDENKEHWYHESFLDEMKSIHFLSTIQVVGALGTTVTLFPEYPHPTEGNKPLLLPKELYALRALTLYPRSKIHMIEPIRDKAHNFNPSQIGEADSIALGINTGEWETFSKPPLDDPNYRIEDNIQGTIKLKLAERRYVRSLLVPNSTDISNASIQPTVLDYNY